MERSTLAEWSCPDQAGQVESGQQRRDGIIAATSPAHRVRIIFRVLRSDFSSGCTAALGTMSRKRLRRPGASDSDSEDAERGLGLVGHHLGAPRRAEDHLGGELLYPGNGGDELVHLLLDQR